MSWLGVDDIISPFIKICTNLTLFADLTIFKNKQTKKLLEKTSLHLALAAYIILQHYVSALRLTL